MNHNACSPGHGPIPKLIHYIWFGGKPKPRPMLAAIEEWRRLMPAYEVREWNETNFDVDSHPWMERMYNEGRFSFASDYARFMILHEHGGIYLDTDMVLKKSIAPLLKGPCVWSFELDVFLATCVIACVPRHPLIADLLAEYDGVAEPRVNNAIVTAYFLRNYPEFKLNNKEQWLPGDIRVLPKEYLVVPAFGSKHNYAVHNSSNPWRADKRKIRFGPLLRPIIGDVLFFKLINAHRAMTGEFAQAARAHRRMARGVVAH